MTFRSVLIANRGEIAIRIARACSELGMRAVTVFSEDDTESLHTRMADEAVALTGRGVKTYLDSIQLINIAKAHGCDAVHPGYGFLAENAAFARQCEQDGLVFIGPSPDVLEKFGDKPSARALAESCDVPLAKGINKPVSLSEARASLNEHGPLMLKAIAGGGGRGMRAVYTGAELEEAFQRCQSETLAAFGNDSLYAEQLISQAGRFYFMEANPRIQVEHTITEEITGIDLVQTQLKLLAGQSLVDLALETAPPVRGFAVQARINSETLHADGHATAATGTPSTYEPPSGPGLRVDGYGYAGYSVSPSFDSLLAKLIAHGSDYPATLRRLYRALCEFRLNGVGSNIGLLQNLIRHSRVNTWAVTTRFVEDNLEALIPGETHTTHPNLHFGNTFASEVAESPEAKSAPAGTISVTAPSSGTVVSIDITPGDAVAVGQPVAVLEAMKMEFVVKATQSGIVHTLAAEPGATVNEGQALVYLEPADVDASGTQSEEAVDLQYVRVDLGEVLERHDLLTNERRPEAVEKRRKTGQQTARENVEDLFDPNSFNEYGALALAAQRRRRSVDKLAELSPADGLITAIGTVNARDFGPETARCATMAYDYTVFAGTQGLANHRKADRILALADQWRLPLVLFAEGGGGRPSDTDTNGVSYLDCHTFVSMARLSGVVPMGWEGAVRLGFAKELAAQPDEESRKKMFDAFVAKAYEQGKALNVASYLEIDAVIDPQETRAWLIRGLNSASIDRSDGGRQFVDTW